MLFGAVSYDTAFLIWQVRTATLCSSVLASEDAYVLDCTNELCAEIIVAGTASLGEARLTAAGTISFRSYVWSGRRACGYARWAARGLAALLRTRRAALGEGAPPPPVLRESEGRERGHS